MTSVIALIGRILLSLIFILSGISKIGDYSGTVAYMTSKGVPFAPFLLYTAVLLEIGGGLSVLTGFRARWGALLLAIYLVPVTFVFHYAPAFDAMTQLAERKMQMIAMLKNFAIIGGLLLIYGNGAGKITMGRDA